MKMREKHGREYPTGVLVDGLGQVIDLAPMLKVPKGTSRIYNLLVDFLDYFYQSENELLVHEILFQVLSAHYELPQHALLDLYQSSAEGMATASHLVHAINRIQKLVATKAQEICWEKVPSTHKNKTKRPLSTEKAPNPWIAPKPRSLPSTRDQKFAHCTSDTSAIHQESTTLTLGAKLEESTSTLLEWESMWWPTEDLLLNCKPELEWKTVGTKHEGKKNSPKAGDQKNAAHLSLRHSIPTKSHQIKIATFNTRWLFLAEPETNTVDTKCPWRTPEEAREHLFKVAKVLDSLDADVYILNEVQNLEALEALCASINGGEQYRTYLVPGYDSCNSMNVGVLAKISKDSEPYRISTGDFYMLADEHDVVQEPRMVCLSKNIVLPMTLMDSAGRTVKIAILGVHLISDPRCRESCAKREAQARILSSEIAQLFSRGYHVVVAGDLNDYDEALCDASGSCPTSGVLEIIKRQGLVNAMTSVPHERLFSTPMRTMIDHILASEGLKVAHADVMSDYLPLLVGVSDHCPSYVIIDLSV